MNADEAEEEQEEQEESGAAAVEKKKTDYDDKSADVAGKYVLAKKAEWRSLCEQYTFLKINIRAI